MHSLNTAESCGIIGSLGCYVYGICKKSVGHTAIAGLMSNVCFGNANERNYRRFKTTEQKLKESEDLRKALQEADQVLKAASTTSITPEGAAIDQASLLLENIRAIREIEAELKAQGGENIRLAEELERAVKSLEQKITQLEQLVLDIQRQDQHEQAQIREIEKVIRLAQQKIPHRRRRG